MKEQEEKLSLDYLKKHCTMIHAFGLGFIQIKLGQEERVHIYCPEAGLTTQEEEIHNHRYDFTSKVLKGCLHNKIYQVQPGTGFVKIKEACNPNLPKDPYEEVMGAPKLVAEFRTTSGESYFLDKDVFHRVQADPGTITYLTRGEVLKEQAEVIHSKGLELTCPFSLKLTEEKLWEIVGRYL